MSALVSWEMFAAVLADQPDLVQRLLALHVPAEDRRCKACTTPGTGTPGARWPCFVYEITALAEQIQVRRSRAAVPAPRRPQ